MEQLLKVPLTTGGRVKLPHGIAALVSQIVEGSISREHLGGSEGVCVGGGW